MTSCQHHPKQVHMNVGSFLCYQKLDRACYLTFATRSCLLVSTKSTVRWSPWILLCGDSGIDTLGASPSSCLLPERIIIMIGPFYKLSYKKKHLLKAPAQVWNVRPRDRKRRWSWSPWEGFTVAALREEVTKLDMCWTHCRDAGSAPAVSPREKTRDLIHLNSFLVCGVVFFFLTWNSGIWIFFWRYVPAVQRRRRQQCFPQGSFNSLLLHGFAWNQCWLKELSDLKCLANYLPHIQCLGA